VTLDGFNVYRDCGRRLSSCRLISLYSNSVAIICIQLHS